MSPSVAEGDSSSVWGRVQVYGLLLALFLLVLDNGFTGANFNSTLWRALICGCFLARYLQVRRGLAPSLERLLLGHPTLCWVMGLWFLLLLWDGSRASVVISPSLVFDHLEWQFWFGAVLFLLMVSLSEEGFEEALLGLWRFALFLALGYGLYQVWVIFPLLQSSMDFESASMDAEMMSRWRSRLFANEPFGWRIYPNLFGLLACYGVWSSLGLAWSLGSRCLILLLSLSMLMLSGAKGALLAMLFTALLLLVVLASKSSKLRRVMLRLALITAPVLALLAWGWGEPLLQLLLPSAKVRWDYWLSAWALVVEHPFGVGVGHFSQYYTAVMLPDATEVRLLHNDHFQVLVERGWLGLLLHGAFWGLLIWQALRRCRADGDLWWCCHSASPEKKMSSTPKAQRFFHVALLCGAVWLVVGGVIGLNGVDLPKFIVPMALVVSLWVWACWGGWSSGGAVWFPLALLLNTFFHACIDFPLHDIPMSVWCMGLVLVFAAHNSSRRGSVQASSCSASSSSHLYLAKLLGSQAWVLSMLLLSMGLLWWHQRLHQLELDLQVKNGIKDELTYWQSWKMPELLAWHHGSWRRAIDAFARDKAKSSSDGLAALDLPHVERQLLEGAIKALPAVAHLQWKYGQLLELLGEQRQALVSYERAAEYHPRQPKYNFALASLAAKLGDVQRAKEHYALALDRHRYVRSRVDELVDLKLHLLKSVQVREAVAALER